MKTRSVEEARNAGLHIIEFHFYGILKMNKSSGSEGITYCLPGTGKGEIQSIQQSRKVSLGLTRIFWNKKKISELYTFKWFYLGWVLAAADDFSNVIGWN